MRAISNFRPALSGFYLRKHFLADPLCSRAGQRIATLFSDEFAFLPQLTDPRPDHVILYGLPTSLEQLDQLSVLDRRRIAPVKYQTDSLFRRDLVEWYSEMQLPLRRSLQYSCELIPRNEPLAGLISRRLRPGGARRLGLHEFLKFSLHVLILALEFNFEVAASKPEPERLLRQYEPQ